MRVITPSATAILQSEQTFDYWTTLFLIIAASTSRDSPRIHIITDAKLNLLGYALCCHILKFGVYIVGVYQYNGSMEGILI